VIPRFTPSPVGAAQRGALILLGTTACGSRGALCGRWLSALRDLRSTWQSTASAGRAAPCRRRGCAAGVGPATCAALRVEGTNRPGLGAKMTGAIGDSGINLRGLSAAVLGSRFVAYMAFDSPEDAEKAAKAINADVVAKAPRKQSGARWRRDDAAAAASSRPLVAGCESELRSYLLAEDPNRFFDAFVRRAARMAHAQDQVVGLHFLLPHLQLRETILGRSHD
jgi:hypothetical protein